MLCPHRGGARDAGVRGARHRDRREGHGRGDGLALRGDGCCARRRCRADMLRLEGFETQVAYRAGTIRVTLAPFGAARVERDPDTVRTDWAPSATSRWRTGTGERSLADNR